MSILYIFLIIFICYIYQLEDDKCVLKICAMGSIIYLLMQNKLLEPSEVPKPIETAKPGEAPKPSEITKPSETAKPSEATKPSEAAKPKTRTFNDIVEDTVGHTINPTSISKYDGLCIKNDNKEGWMKYPDNIPLIKDNDLYVSQGFTNPTEPVFSDSSQMIGPSVDGDPDSSKSLFMLRNNVVSPLCCPSTFSTSSGCVCTTEKQRNYVNNRGYGNQKLCTTD